MQQQAAPPQAPPQQQFQQQQMAPAAPAAQMMEAYNNHGLNISFSLEKDPANNQATKITASFVNSAAADCMDLSFQCAVPKFMTLGMNPPTSTTVPANRAGAVTQVINITNSMVGQKAAMIRVKLQFLVNGQNVDDMVQISNFPPGI